MAGMSGMSSLGPSGARDLPEQVEGQSNAKKIEEFLEMVEKLQQAESLDPRIEDLVKRVKEFQKLKQKASEEVREARALWEAKQKELDSLNGEQLRLEEVLRKKQETLRIFLLQCKGKESEAQRKLFEEENRKAKEFLEAASKQHQQLQHKRQRLMAEMEKLDMQFLSEIHIAPEEGVSKEEAQCLPQGIQELPLGPQDTKSEPAPGQAICLPRRGGK